MIQVGSNLYCTAEEQQLLYERPGDANMILEHNGVDMSKAPFRFWRIDHITDEHKSILKAITGKPDLKVVK